MGMESNTYVAVFKDSAGNLSAVKCRATLDAGCSVILVEDSDGRQCAVCAESVKESDILCFKAKDANNMDTAVRVCITRQSFIGMAWIDEAESIYTATADTYEADIANFKNLTDQSEKYVALCQSPTISSGSSKGIHRCVYNEQYPESYGVDIQMEDIGRNDDGHSDIGDSDLINRFEELLSDFQSKTPTSITMPTNIILTIDDSGSMDQNTIDPAYTNLVTYIQENYPNINLVITSYRDEAWIGIWVDQLNEII